MQDCFFSVEMIYCFFFFFTSYSKRMKFHCPLGVVETKCLKMIEVAKVCSLLLYTSELHWKLQLLPQAEFLIISQ